MNATAITLAHAALLAVAAYYWSACGRGGFRGSGAGVARLAEGATARAGAGRGLSVAGGAAAHDAAGCAGSRRCGPVANRAHRRTGGNRRARSDRGTGAPAGFPGAAGHPRHGERESSRWRAAVLFDLAVAALIAVYITAFLWAGAAASDLITPDILRIRAFGTAALILWTAWLAAAPLARLEPRLAVLGVHAGHLAVATLAAGAVHAWLVLNWYHDIGTLNPLVALLADNPRFLSLPAFPTSCSGSRR